MPDKLPIRQLRRLNVLKTPGRLNQSNLPNLSEVEASMPESNNLPQNNAPVIIKQSGGKALAAGATVLALLGLGASGSCLYRVKMF